MPSARLVVLGGATYFRFTPMPRKWTEDTGFRSLVVNVRLPSNVAMSAAVKRTGILQLLPGASSPRQLPGGIAKDDVTVTFSIVTVWLVFSLDSVTDRGPRVLANGTRPKLIDFGVTLRADSTGVTVAVGVGVIVAVAVGPGVIVGLGVLRGVGLGVTGGGGVSVPIGVGKENSATKAFRPPMFWQPGHLL